MERVFTRMALLALGSASWTIAGLLSISLVTGCSDGTSADDVVACADEVDNDQDGLVDFPEDPGCDAIDDPDESNPPLPACSDFVDNDGDGRIDYPYDPGCFSPFADDEVDGCPSDPRCPQCANLVDDDDDGAIDFPNDVDCEDAVDTDEFDPALTCNGVVPIALTLPTVVTGASMANESLEQSPICGGQGQETAYRFTLTQPAIIVATTEFDDTTLDTVLYLRRACSDASSEIACNDDIDSAADVDRSRIEVNIDAGMYFLLVDASNIDSAGEYRLQVDIHVPPGGACDPGVPGQCTPGYECNPVVEDPSMSVCALPMCMDGQDNDMDGTIDHPDDPGCVMADDNDESDDCPTGPMCPECGNGIDDDFDGTTDYPDDIGCSYAGHGTEFDCPGEQDPLEEIVAGTTTGTTTGASDDATPSCTTSASPDRVYSLSVPTPLSSLFIDTSGSGFDTVLTVKVGECDQPELTCDDDGAGESHSAIEMSAVAVGTYVITVDGWSKNEGPYQLNVRGVIEDGGACDPAMISSELYACGPTHRCDGSVCVPVACSNELDDDSDGLVDLDDPGCQDTTDEDEMDDCPDGPMCPACANGVDDDMDGQTDHPTDIGCLLPSDSTETLCSESSEPVELLTTGTITGSTTAATDDFTPSCSSGVAQDRTYALQVTSPLSSLTVDTNGSSFDTILTIKQELCTNADLNCDDDGGDTQQSQIERSSVIPGLYLITVDGDLGASGDYTLNVRGVIEDGAECDPASIASGLFACGANHACDGSICAPAACANMVDDDADGRIDFVADPGCATTEDDDEADDCPDGPMCPTCANGVDDDGDGAVDFPSDLGCDDIRDDDEQNCDDSDPIVTVNMPMITGDTSLATNDYTPSCTLISLAPEIAHVLHVPSVLPSLRLNTFGSSFDTALYVRLTECAASDWACDDDTGESQSQLTLSNVPAGPLYIVVDGYSTDAGAYTLNISGEIAGGERCDSPLVAQGVLVCETGYTCTNDVCTPECSNGVDDDGDTFIDFPADPECASGIDANETI